MNNLQVDLNGLVLKNPVTMASGTFGCGREYLDFFDPGILGAISVKGITLLERKGNPAPRLHETTMGLLNSVGLQNPGVEHFIAHEIPFLRQYDTKIIANINGSTIEDYRLLADRLDGEDVDSIELNVSCPNVKAGGMSFGTDPTMLRQTVRAVRAATEKHLIVKLTPNVTDIAQMAHICQEEGAQAISLVNTFSGMAIDVQTMKPVFHLVGAGLSGPAIKPLALKKVYEAYASIDIPILGMGGIRQFTDGLEFMMAGATAIAIGTAIFTNPYVVPEIIEAFEKYSQDAPITHIIGIANQK